MSDPGLAPQRTRLSWRRTLLALTVVGLLCVRLAVRKGIDTPDLLAAAGAMLLWVGALFVTYHRAGRMDRSRSESPGLALPLYAAASAGYAALGTILILTHLPR
jgi:uncharacterized membrane protein YidH (DUF202 family)